MIYECIRNSTESVSSFSIYPLGAINRYICLKKLILTTGVLKRSNVSEHTTIFFILPSFRIILSSFAASFLRFNLFEHIIWIYFIVYWIGIVNIFLLLLFFSIKEWQNVIGGRYIILHVRIVQLEFYSATIWQYLKYSPWDTKAFYFSR